MSYDYTPCKRSLECLFGLSVLGKMKSWYRFASSELRCLPLERKLGLKMTCGNWYPPIWCHTKKRYQLPGNILVLQWFDNLTESHLHYMVLWTVIGAWVGAFPIPLDWDRPWQTWPVTCCIGASLGNSVIHLLIGSKIFYGLFRDRRKIAYNRSV
ncbi:phosphatidylinositol-glycan biosynthesis class F protein [Trichonephila clavipes]|nr:phosphatidylinositol-glycan biosynthesis class F protein [Trichonephila clavipes]